jgi:hypothetical protein
MKLTESNMNTIRDVIGRSDISVKTMQEDILDHLCCAVEKGMEKGQDFKIAFSDSLAELSPKGLNEIEKETFYLLHPNILAMKKLMYSFGLIFSMMVAIGIFMKLMHLAGANEISLIGFGGLLTVYVPLGLVIHSHQAVKQSTPEKFQYRFGLLSMVILSAAGIMKLIHVTGANEMLMIGTIVFSFGYLPYLFLRMYRESIA